MVYKTMLEIQAVPMLEFLVLIKYDSNFESLLCLSWDTRLMEANVDI